MSETARIPAVEVTGVYGLLIRVFGRRMLGKVPESIGVMWNNPAVFKALFGLGRKAERTWNRCDENLKTYAHMAVAARIGCSFCLDLGYFQAHNLGLDESKAREVPRWRESEVFTPLERDVMAYAEALSQTPPTVSDELSQRLLERLGAPALLELTAFAGLANATARTNVALGIRSEGFADACELAPLARPTQTSEAG
jgi:alkylhydroperoxidase family enzyme